MIQGKHEGNEDCELYRDSLTVVEEEEEEVRTVIWVTVAITQWRNTLLNTIIWSSFVFLLAWGDTHCWDRGRKTA